MNTFTRLKYLTRSRNNWFKRSFSSENIINIKSSNLPLNHVIKVHCNKSAPDQILPWQNKQQRSSTGSGFIISDKRILTNAHVIANSSFVTVTKHSESTHYPCNIDHVGHECDLALLSVNDNSFWNNISGHLEFDNKLPELQDTCTVLGFPTGGETISVTSGVVSRVEVVQYIHAACSLLGIQIDAAINAGNSGGPAFGNNLKQVIGVAFQNLSDAEGIGYIIPTTIINRFLDDISKFGKYVGFCTLGVQWQSLSDTKDMHSFFGLDGNKYSGILITKVHNNTPAKLADFREFDIVTHVDNNIIYNDGMTSFREHEQVEMSHLISKKFEGDKINVKIWRKSENKFIDKIVTLSVNKYLVPIHTYNKLNISYYIFGGCVFVPLTQPYLHSWGEDWYHHAPKELVLECVKGTLPDKKTKEEVIVMSIVLPDESNMGYYKQCNLMLEKIGNENIKSLNDLKCVIENKIINGETLIDIYFKDNRMIVLNVNKTLNNQFILLERHKIYNRQSKDLNEYNNTQFENILQKYQNNNVKLS